ncbi:hypothetical protein L559_1027 [Bordetella pertussis STO1-CHOC-0017]|nr:hypothetical protein L559_1027 [Bordetella pertussis STO1-CHOC-0017]
MVDELLQLLGVGVQVGDGTRGHAALHGRLGHRRRDAHDQARIERLGNQVVAAKRNVIGAVGRGHDLVLFFARQAGDGQDRRLFHLARDRGRAHVQRAAEDVRKAQHVVDLVRVIRTAGGHDDVVAHRVRRLGQDLGVGVGQRQDQRVGRHGGHHLGLEHVAGRQAQEHVRALDHLGQGAGLGLAGEAFLVGVHQLLAALVDHAFDVGDPDMLQRQSQVHQQIQAGQGGGAGARGHQLDVLDALAGHGQAVDHGRAYGDGGAVLVVVEHRDLHALAQLALDREALRRLDVFQVDAAEGGFQPGDDLHQLVRVGLVDLDVEHVQPGELLEQHRLAFHHRLGGQRADVAQPQHRRAVGDHAHQVAPPGVAEHIHRIVDDLLAGGGHARRVGQAEVALIAQLFGGGDRNLAGAAMLVIFQRGLAKVGVHDSDDVGWSCESERCGSARRKDATRACTGWPAAQGAVALSYSRPFAPTAPDPARAASTPSGSNSARTRASRRAASAGALPDAAGGGAAAGASSTLSTQASALSCPSNRCARLTPAGSRGCSASRR